MSEEKQVQVVRGWDHEFLHEAIGRLTNGVRADIVCDVLFTTYVKLAVQVFKGNIMAIERDIDNVMPQLKQAARQEIVNVAEAEAAEALSPGAKPN